MSLTIQDYLIYLLLTAFLFFFFVIIISIFGMIFYNYLNKRSGKEWNHNFFEKFILSFGIGFSIYIPLCFLIAIFRFMNFFTIYLPIIIIDSIYICRLIFIYKINKKRIILFIKNKFIKVKRDKIIFICILLFIFLMAFLFQWNIISYNMSLYEWDSFIWAWRSFQLSKDGYIAKDYAMIYPQGFRIFCAACLSLLIFPNFQITYFFHKFMPIPLLLFYILVLALIIKRIFKKNYLVLFGLIMILSTNYFNYRLFQFLSSNIATLLFLISLIVLLSKCSRYLLGFFITSIYLFNPIVALFYYIPLFFFTVIKLLYINKKLIKDFFIEIIKTLILIGLLFLPFMIFLFFNNFNIFSILRNPIFGNVIQLNQENYIFWLNLSELKEGFLETLTDHVPSDRVFPESYKNYYKYNTIIFSFFFIFAVLGLSLKNAENKTNDLLIFLKCVIIIVIILCFLPVIFPEILISTSTTFKFILRILEIYSAPIIIMECFTIDFIRKKAKFLTNYLTIKSKHYNNLLKNNILSKVVNFENIFITILLISTYSNYYINSQENNYHWDDNYLFTDEQIESILFINEKISSGSKILVPDLYSGLNGMYKLLHDYKYYIWDYDKKECYYETKNYIHKNDIEYLLIDFITIRFSELNYFLINNENFKVVYENNRNIIFKTKGNLKNYYDFDIFQGTWNFIDEKVDTSGKEIDFINYYRHSDKCPASIKSSVDNHRNVLDLDNHKTKGFIKIENHFDDVESGTIEFWWRTTDVNQESHFALKETFNNYLAKIRIYHSKFQYYDGSNWQDLKSGILNNEWYHVRIDFECGDKGYEGLPSKRFNLYIDNVLESHNVTFYNTGEDVSKLYLYSLQESYDFHTYFDAFGYSWDTDYDVGDNLNKIYL